MDFISYIFPNSPLSHSRCVNAWHGEPSAEEKIRHNAVDDNDKDDETDLFSLLFFRSRSCTFHFYFSRNPNIQERCCTDTADKYTLKLFSADLFGLDFYLRVLLLLLSSCLFNPNVIKTDLFWAKFTKTVNNT